MCVACIYNICISAKHTDTTCGHVCAVQLVLDGHNGRQQWAAILLLVQYIQLYDCTKLVVCPLNDPVVYGLSVDEHDSGHLLHRHPVSGNVMARHTWVHDHEMLILIDEG